MKASEIVNHLQKWLPQQTNRFTRNFPVTIDRAGDLVTVTSATQGHQLQVGDAVAFAGAYTPINIISIDRVGTVATVKTASRHNFTTGDRQTSSVVTISGANEDEFNGTFPFLACLTPTKFTMQVEDDGPTEVSGDPILLNGEPYLRTYNRTFRVGSVLSPVAFTLTDSRDLVAPVGSIECRAKPQITGAVDYNSAIEAYTAQETPGLWAFVCLDDEISSVSRFLSNDAIEVFNSSNDLQQRMIQSFSIYVIADTSGEIAGRPSTDEMQDLKLFLSRCLIGKRFDSDWNQPAESGVVWDSMGVQGYYQSHMTYRFSFQQMNVVCRGSSFKAMEDYALREINLDIYSSVGTGVEFVEADVTLPEADEIEV